MNPYVTQYQSANLSNEQSIDNFVVRTKEFERVMADIRTTDKQSSFQHYVFVGRRGSGKSTLLRRIQAEVCTDPELKEKFIVTNLSEEQAGIYKLFDLWDYVMRDLRAKDYSLPEIDWQEYQDDLKEYTKVLYRAIHDLLHQEDKRLILLVDNIDRIFKNIGKDANLLREQLMNFNDVRIIGGSTIMAEEFWRYDMPFYQFFSIKRLEPLSMEEIKMLLEHWAEVKGNPEIAKFVERHPGKIQAVRMLTDGTPRTMQLFVDMLIDRSNEQGFDYLRRIIDNATPIYQERLLQLSHQQQKIVTELSFFWEAASVEQLVPVCKMTGKNISAQMAQLVKARIVEKVKGEKKNMYYRLEERFFNLWLLMTQGGPKQKKEARYLTVFLEAWYDREEILNFYDDFVALLQSERCNPEFSNTMAKALVHSKHITIDQRDKLIDAIVTKGKNEKWASENMPEKAWDMFRNAISAVLEKRFQQASTIIASIEQKDPFFLSFLATTQENLGLKEKAISSLEEGLALIESKKMSARPILVRLISEQDAKRFYDERKEKFVLDTSVFYVRLGKLHESLQNEKKAETFYQLAVNAGNPDAMGLLAMLYYRSNRKPTEALRLITRYDSAKPNLISTQITKKTIELWNGRIEMFVEGNNELITRIISEAPEYIGRFVKHMLVHKLYHYVEELFESREFGGELKSRVSPLYYVSLMLLNGNDSRLIKMPPELLAECQAMQDKLRSKQEFYYGKPS